MTFLALAVAALVFFMLAGTAIIALCNAADSKPQQETKPMSNYQTVRTVRTFPGESLKVGIRRAFTMSFEYPYVILFHDGTAVTVTRDHDPYGIEAEWNAVRKVQNARRVCEGRVAVRDMGDSE